jgi:Mce-associated membrane protein
VTVVVEKTETEIHTTATIGESSQINLASWRIRASAFAIDVLPPIAVVATMLLVSLTVPPRGVWWWVCLCVAGAVFLLMWVNRSILPTVTGWSLGRALCGIEVVRRDGTPPGVWGLLVRDLAHLLDTASLMVGWLWPLGDSHHRTFADILLRTEVRRVEPSKRLPEIRRWTAAAVLTATGLCLLGAAVSFFVVYARERATDEARAEVGTQGPKIVAQLLTYDPNSLHDDFARARSLATDKYRGQLASQQEAVEKGHPVINEYRVTDSAIQSATPDRVTMLLFMDGRRGAGPEERYITATVRVTFAKGRDDRWRVDDLTVVTKPKPPGGGK